MCSVGGGACWQKQPQRDTGIITLSWWVGVAPNMAKGQGLQSSIMNQA